MTVTWATGPETVVALEAWCVEHGTTLSKLAKSCTPEVPRSTFTRWRAGADPAARVLRRLQDGMQRYELKQLLGA